MKQILIFLVLGIILLSGCQVEDTLIQENETAQESNVIEIGKGSGQTATSSETQIVTQSGYSREKLEEDINSLFDMKDYIFKQDKTRKDFFLGNGQKFLMIQVLDDNINTAEIFYKEFGALNWEDNLYFLNKSEMNLLHPPLTEKNFSREQEYMDYKQNRALVEQTISEKTIELENGKVLEYQFINWMYSPSNQFQGAWEDTLLIYKVYCSPDLVVLLRPDWEKIQWGTLGQSMEEAHKTWEANIERIKPELLETADSILAKCPVRKSFFNSLPDKEVKKTKDMAYYYKTHLKYYWDLSTDVKTEIEPLSNEDKYLLKRIEVTFTNNEPETLWGYLDLDVETLADGKTDYIFADKKAIADKILPGKSVTRGVVPEEDNEFAENITIDFKLMYGSSDLPVRPFSITIDKNNNVIKS